MAYTDSKGDIWSVFVQKLILLNNAQITLKMWTNKIKRGIFVKNYDVIAHAVDVIGAKNDLESCISDLENHRKNVNSIKVLLTHNWEGNTAKKLKED